MADANDGKIPKIDNRRGKPVGVRKFGLTIIEMNRRCGADRLVDIGEPVFAAGQR